MKNWLMVSKSKSDKETFKFIHHSSSSVIQLQMKNNNGSLTDFWMDYYEFDELCDLLNKLSENKQKITT
jgi:hypothetical protein